MNIELHDAGPCRKKVDIEIAAEQVGEIYSGLLNQYVSSARIAGFRKGKAPRELVEKRYRKDLRGDVLDQLYSDSFAHIREDEDLKIVKIVDLKGEDNIDPSSAYRFSVIVDVAPQFELPEYKKLQLKGGNTVVAEDEVDRSIDRIREQQASYEEVNDRPVRLGDMVQVDFESILDDRPLQEVVPGAEKIAQAKGFWLLADEDSFLPGIEKGLEGAEIGETREITVTFDDDFSLKEIAGKSPVYTMTVKAIREKRLPEIDDAFLRRNDIESVEALRKTIRESLERMVSRNETARLKNEVALMMLDRTQIDVPQSEVESMTEQVIGDLVREQTARGVKREEIEENKDKIFQEARSHATNRIKLRYITSRIAEEEKIEVSEQDMKEYFAAMAMQHGLSEESIRQMVEKNETVDQVKQGIRLNKVLESLVEWSEIT